MLERAKASTRQGRYHYIEYARFADDLVILMLIMLTSPPVALDSDALPRSPWERVEDDRG